MNFVQPDGSIPPVQINPINLQKGKIVKIQYNGPVAQGDTEVWAHVGFSNGEEWEAIRQVKMNPTTRGYEAIIAIKDYESLNMVFTNDFIHWDNNEGQNYSFPISWEK